MLPPLDIEHPGLAERVDVLQKRVGNRLKKWRKLRRLTVEQVAARSAVRVNLIKQIEGHGRPRISLTDVLRICFAIGIDPSHLFVEAHRLDLEE